MNTKDNWDTTATIYDRERRELWSFVFPGARVPIKSIVPQPVNVPGHQNVNAYFLDLDAITDFQRDKLIAVLSTRFNVPFEEVQKDIVNGVPILADGVMVDSSDQALFFSLVEDGLVSFGGYEDELGSFDLDDEDEL